MLKREIMRKLWANAIQPSKHTDVLYLYQKVNKSKPGETHHRSERKKKKLLLEDK